MRERSEEAKFEEGSKRKRESSRDGFVELTTFPLPSFPSLQRRLPLPRPSFPGCPSTTMPTLSALLPPSKASLPALPSAPSSLAFVGGPLPASSPLHLVLSSLSSNDPKAKDRALILTQDLQAWTSYLLSDGKGRDGDAWLREEAGRGREVGRLARVEVRFVSFLAFASQ